jgi:hypothetical protein
MNSSIKVWWLNMARLRLNLLGFGLFMFTATIFAQVPEQCVQSVQRSDVCPNVLYKRSPVDLLPFSVQKGDMVCLCLTDFAQVRQHLIADRHAQAEQLLQQMSAELNIASNDLKTLLNK